MADVEYLRYMQCMSVAETSALLCDNSQSELNFSVVLLKVFTISGLFGLTDSDEQQLHDQINELLRHSKKVDLYTLIYKA